MPMNGRSTASHLFLTAIINGGGTAALLFLTALKNEGMVTISWNVIKRKSENITFKLINELMSILSPLECFTAFEGSNFTIYLL